MKRERKNSHRAGMFGVFLVTITTRIDYVKQIGSHVNQGASTSELSAFLSHRLPDSVNKPLEVPKIVKIATVITHRCMSF